MDTQTQAHIFLSDQRGCSQTDHFRSFHSFNFGQYISPDRQPFGDLCLLNDDVLKAEQSVCLQVETNTEVIIIPLVGGLEYKSDAGHGFLETGQALLMSLTRGMEYELTNPYETELINYLTIWLTNSSPAFTHGTEVIKFDLQTKNELLPLCLSLAPASHFRGFIGRYDGRAEDFYHLTSPTKGVYVFVISGAFEVQNRLLHERDGLSLMKVKDNVVDFEALSNDALLLLLEIPLAAR